MAGMYTHIPPNKSSQIKIQINSEVLDTVSPKLLVTSWMQSGVGLLMLASSKPVFTTVGGPRPKSAFVLPEVGP